MRGGDKFTSRISRSLSAVVVVVVDFEGINRCNGEKDFFSGFKVKWFLSAVPLCDVDAAFISRFSEM